MFGFLSDMIDDQIRKNISHVNYVVRGMRHKFPRNIHEEDLHSFGLVGLWTAIVSFDKSRGISFENYARQKIYRTIIDELRKLDIVPRETRENRKKIDRAAEKLEILLGRTPNEEELAVELKITPAKLKRIQEKAFIPVFEPIEVIDREDDSANFVRQIYEREQMFSVLRAAEVLSDREKYILAEYLNNQPFKEIGEKLKISESLTCRLYKEIIKKLKEKICRMEKATETE